MTPLDFVPAIRAQLNTASLTDEGLLSHGPTELELMQDIEVLNLTRFLLALNWEQTTGNGNGIDIRDRVINQLNAALPNLTGPIDFSASEADFTAAGTSPSPANQLLAEICFYPADNELCEESPTPEEIENAPEAPENPDERESGVDYRQDLQNKRERILNAIRTMESVSQSEARDYLRRELDIVSQQKANQYYLNASTATHPASNTGIKTVRIRKIDGQPQLTNLEAQSTNDVNVVVHSFDRQAGTVEYFIDGNGGGEGEVLVNFRPSGDYRWVKKQIRVIID